jgi:hypothetical protein
LRVATAVLNPQVFVQRLGVPETEPAVRRAFLLALGGLAEDRFSKDRRAHVIPVLWQLYRNDSDPGVHSAARWLLTHWGLDDELHRVDKELISHEPKAGRGWYVNPEGQTLAILELPSDVADAAEASMAVEPPVKEAPAAGNTMRQIAVCTTEVTREQFGRFRGETERPDRDATEDRRPASSVSFEEALRYCNWLSQREGIPEEQFCYRRAADGKSWEPVPGCIRKTGYRLPTVEEWIFAASAGAETTRFYGETEEDLVQFAWYVRNAAGRTQPVALLRPNDFGLFDVLGNVCEWSHRRPSGKDRPRYGYGLGSSYDSQARNISNTGRLVISRGELGGNSSFGLRVIRSLPSLPK